MSIWTGAYGAGGSAPTRSSPCLTTTPTAAGAAGRGVRLPSLVRDSGRRWSPGELDRPVVRGEGRLVIVPDCEDSGLPLAQRDCGRPDGAVEESGLDDRESAA